MQRSLQQSLFILQAQSASQQWEKQQQQLLLLTVILGLFQDHKVIYILTQAVEPKTLVRFLLVALYTLNSADRGVRKQHYNILVI